MLLPGILAGSSDIKSWFVRGRWGLQGSRNRPGTPRPCRPCGSTQDCASGLRPRYARGTRESTSGLDTPVVIALVDSGVADTVVHAMLQADDLLQRGERTRVDYHLPGDQDWWYGYPYYSPWYWSAYYGWPRPYNGFMCTAVTVWVGTIVDSVGTVLRGRLISLERVPRHTR